MYKILIIEDDTTICQALSKHLKSWNMEAKGIEDFNNILHEFVTFQPHLVIMDISLPYFDGYHWTSEIRKVSQVPLIFLSSANDSMNIVMAMSMGADDFIAKPFDLQILTAKILALLRRTYDFKEQNNMLEHKGVVLNSNDFTLLYKDSKLTLSKNEFKILQVLLENKGRIVSRDTIMTHLWESDAFIDDNTLSVNMNRIRRKLEDIGLENFIITKKGLGYLVD